ncbi:MAG TPA: peptidoglycan DD-metalloendopeptidase family protein [Fibrobacteria bacterium]|nr:peptidoglycan DD-metalloendopeptidase family protein [Fibrobacteria bacterium]
MRSALLVLSLCGALHAASVNELEDRIADEKKELSRMRSELEDGRRHLDEISEKAKNQEAELAQVESNIQLGGRILQRLDSTESLYRDLVQRSQADLESATASWKGRRTLLARRIRQMYEKGRPRPEVAWIGSSDPDEWARTLADFRSVVRADRDLLDLVVVRQREASRQLEAHRLRVAGLEEIASQKQQEMVQLEAARTSKAGTLAELKNREGEERQRLSELEASQKALTTLLASLERRREKAEEDRRKAEEEAKKREEEHKRAEEQHRKEAILRKKEGKPPPPPVKIALPSLPPPVEDKALEGPPPARQGLCWPVQGAVLSRFGLEKNPVLGTVTRNLGVEIGGKAGQSVLSAAAGRVAAVTELPGRGTTVILEHPGGYFSIYGQLSHTRVSEGQAVAACAEVGTLASLVPPRVYFEYRHNLKAEDPLEWLTR